MGFSEGTVGVQLGYSGGRVRVQSGNKGPPCGGGVWGW